MRCLIQTLPKLLFTLALLGAGLSAPHSAQAQPVVGSKSFCIIDPGSGACGPAVLQAAVGEQVGYQFDINNSFGNSAIANFHVTENFSPDFVPNASNPVTCVDSGGAAYTPTISYAGPPSQPPATLTFDPLPAGAALTCTFRGSYTQTSTAMPNLVTGPNGAHSGGNLDVVIIDALPLDSDFAITKEIINPQALDLTSGSAPAAPVHYRFTLSTTGLVQIDQNFRIFDQMNLGLGSIALNASVQPAISCAHVQNPGPGNPGLTASLATPVACALDTNLGNPLNLNGSWTDFISFALTGASFPMQPEDLFTVDFFVDISLPADAACQRQDTQQVLNAGFVTLANGAIALNDLDNSNNRTGYGNSIVQEVLTDLPTDADCAAATGGTVDDTPPSPLVVTKTAVDGPGIYAWGDEIAYDITIENTDPNHPVTNLTIYDIVRNLAFTPNFDVQLLYADLLCPAPSVCAIISPATIANAPGPVGQIQGYSDSEGMLSATIDQLAPLATAQLKVVLKYTDPHCDTAPLYPEKWIRNQAGVNHLYSDPDDPATQFFGTSADSADVQMNTPETCEIRTRKEQITPGPIVFDQPMTYELTFYNGGAPTTMGSLIDALRILDSNYAQSMAVDYQFTCDDGGTGVTGYQTGGSGSGQVTYVSQANQGLRLMDHPGFVVFPTDGTLSCKLEIILRRPSTSDPYCFSNINEVPHLQNTAIMDQALFYDANLSFPTGPAGYNHHSARTELPRCINASLNKTVAPLVTGPQGPPADYKVVVQNHSQSGSDGDIAFTAASGSGLHLLDAFDANANPPLPALSLTADPCTGSGAPCSWAAQPGDVTVHAIGAGQTLDFEYSATPDPEFTPHELCNDITGALEIGGQPFNPDRWYIQRPLVDRACIEIRNTLKISKVFELPAGEAMQTAAGDILVDVNCTHPDAAITPVVLTRALNAANGWQTDVFVHVGSTCTVAEQAPPASLLYPHCTWAAPAYAPGASVTTTAALNDWPVQITNSFTCAYTALDILKQVNSADGPQPGANQSFGTPPAGMLFDMMATCTDGVNPDQTYQVQLASGDVDTITNIPVGMSCTVTETLPTSSEDGCFWKVGFAPSANTTVTNGQNKSLISDPSPNQIKVYNAYICEDDVPPPLLHDLEVIKLVNTGPAAPGYALHTPPAGAIFDITPDCGTGTPAPLTFGTSGGSQIVAGQTPGALCTATENITSNGGPNDLCRWRTDVTDITISAAGPNVLTVNNTFECPAPFEITKSCDPIPAGASDPYTLNCEIEITGGTHLPVPGWFSFGDFFFGLDASGQHVDLPGTVTFSSNDLPTGTPPCQYQQTPGAAGLCLVDTADLIAAGGAAVINAQVTFSNPDGLQSVRNCALRSDPEKGPAPNSNAKSKSLPLTGSALDNDETHFDCVDIPLPPPPVTEGKGDLSLTKTLIKDDDPYKVFALNMTLTGDPVTAPALYVLDDVPSGMIVQSAGDSNWQCNPLPLAGAGQLICEYTGSFPIAAGPLPPLYVEVIDKGAEKPNCAVVITEKLGDGYVDTNPSNNSDCADDQGKPDIALEKTLEEIEPGYGIFTLDVTVSGAPVTAPMLMVSDDVPAGLQMSFIGNAPWDCQPAQVQGPAQVLCEYQGSYPIPVGALAPIRFEAKYEPGVTNCATVIVEKIEGGYDDSNPDNNSDCAVTPGTPAPVKFGKLEVIKAITPVPGTPQNIQNYIAPPPANTLYDIAVTCTDGVNPAIAQTLTYQSLGGAQVIAQIPYGMTCTATEPPPPAANGCYWQTNITGPVTIGQTANAQITVTNTYKCSKAIVASVPGRFNIIKQIDADSAPVPAGTQFPFAVTGCAASAPNPGFAYGSDFSNGAAQQQITHPSGTCTVTEQPPVSSPAAGCTWAAPLYSTDNGASWSQTPASITGATFVQIGQPLPSVRVRNKLLCESAPPVVSMTKTCVPNPLTLGAPGPQQITCTLTLTGSNLAPNELITVTDTLTSSSGGASPVVTSVPAVHSGTQFLGCAFQGAPNQVICYANSSDVNANGTISTDVTLTLDNAWETGDLRNCVAAEQKIINFGNHATGSGYSSDETCVDIQVIKDDVQAPEITYEKSCIPDPIQINTASDPFNLRCNITVSGTNLVPGQTISFDESMSRPGSPYNVSIASVNAVHPDMDCTLTQGPQDAITCATTTDAVINAGGSLSGWISIVIENTGASGSIQNCVATSAPQGGAKNLPPVETTCVQIPVIVGDDDESGGDGGPIPGGGVAALAITKTALGACDVNRNAQTYTCGFGFTITNKGDAPYNGPLVVSDAFVSGPAVRSVRQTSGKGWSCPGNNAEAASCLKGAGNIGAGGADSFEMELTLAGLRDGGRFCNMATLGLGDSPFMRTIVVQEAMRLLGVSGGPSDGKPGPQTRRGVRALQGNFGLPPTGEIDDALLAALGVRVGSDVSSGEVCVALPPMPLPPLQCDRRTARNISDTACACRYDGMVKAGKTSCNCTADKVFKPGTGCVARPRDLPRTCAAGTELINGKCIVTDTPAQQCDTRSTVARGDSCACRYKGMRRLSATQCVCRSGAPPVAGAGCP